MAITGARVSKLDRRALFSAALSGIVGSIIRTLSSLAERPITPIFIILYLLVNLLFGGVFMG
jgi:hypothetical protein